MCLDDEIMSIFLYFPVKAWIVRVNARAEPPCSLGGPWPPQNFKISP